MVLSNGNLTIANSEVFRYGHKPRDSFEVLKETPQRNDIKFGRNVKSSNFCRDFSPRNIFDVLWRFHFCRGRIVCTGKRRPLLSE